MSEKLQLPTVTLVAIDCVNASKAIKVLEHCKKLCDFGEVKLLTSIPVTYEHRVKIMPLNSLIAYSVFMLTRFNQYITTPNILIVQCDGWVLNPDSFDMTWLELDYLGGLFMQMDRCGSGGFSLRSKKIMDYAAEITPSWDGTQKNAEEITAWYGYYEDGSLSLTDQFKEFKIGSLEQAANFSQAGNRNPIYFREKPFGWHRSWQSINFETGIVDSSDTSRDVTVGYDAEIDTLSEIKIAE